MILIHMQLKNKAKKKEYKLKLDKSVVVEGTVPILNNKYCFLQ